MSSHQIIIVGNAVKDAEEKISKNDTLFAKFVIAVNEYIKNKNEERSYYYDVLVFGKNYQKVLEHIKLGDSVLVVGKPEVSAHISDKDNEAKGKITIIAESWKVLK